MPTLIAPFLQSCTLFSHQLDAKFKSSSTSKKYTQSFIFYNCLVYIIVLQLNIHLTVGLLRSVTTMHAIKVDVMDITSIHISQ